MESQGDTFEIVNQKIVDLIRIFKMPSELSDFKNMEIINLKNGLVLLMETQPQRQSLNEKKIPLSKIYLLKCKISDSSKNTKNGQLGTCRILSRDLAVHKEDNKEAFPIPGFYHKLYIENEMSCLLLAFDMIDEFGITLWQQITMVCHHNLSDNDELVKISRHYTQIQTDEKLLASRKFYSLKSDNAITIFLNLGSLEEKDENKFETINIMFPDSEVFKTKENRELYEKLISS